MFFVVNEQLRQILHAHTVPVADGAVGRQVRFISYEPVRLNLFRLELIGRRTIYK